VPLIVSLYESFAAAPFGGNVAGVVLLGEPLPEAIMQGIAGDLAAPTTGFVTVEGPGAARVRHFTPRREIGACGHVNLGVATCLVEERLWPLLGARIRQVTSAGGDVGLRLRRDGRAVSVEMSHRLLAQLPARVEPAEVSAAIGTPAIDGWPPMGIVSTGLRHLLVPLTSEADLAGLRLEAGLVTALAERCDVDTVGVFAVQRTGAVRLRDLCARIGDLEEPASGTTSTALGAHLARHAGWRAVRVEQGFEMGRPSLLDVKMKGDGEIAVCGIARRVLRGELTPWPHATEGS
jgi:PhzF family phenazine biosynthesis protein